MRANNDFKSVLVEKKPFFIIVTVGMNTGWWYAGSSDRKLEVRRGTSNDAKKRAGYINHLSEGFYVITEEGVFAGCCVAKKHATKLHK